jgi:hypothetical protein
MIEDKGYGINLIFYVSGEIGLWGKLKHFKQLLGVPSEEIGVAEDEFYGMGNYVPAYSDEYTEPTGPVILFEMLNGQYADDPFYVSWESKEAISEYFKFKSEKIADAKSRK